MTDPQSLKRIVELEDRITELEAERDAALAVVRQLREALRGDTVPMDIQDRLERHWAALAAAARVLGETK